MNIFRKITIKNLVKNRTRTFVTIIGIILSLAMFTAVTTSVASLRDYLINVFTLESGSWYGAVYDINNENVQALKNNEKVTQTVSIGNIGYAQIGSENTYKPYLFIGEITADAQSLLPIYLTEGRMPANSSEIVLPEHLSMDGKVDNKIGDTLTLEIGQRSLDGEQLTQRNSLDTDEVFTAEKEQTYTVVGFYKRPSFEPYSAAGYTALTYADGTNSTSTCDLYLRTKLVWSIHSVLSNDATDGCITAINSDLLRMSGATMESDLNGMIYGLAGVLMLIIMFGSVSLIYNSFSISVSERTKQFGLLKSIGATKKQVLQSVLFEAMALCVIGVPLGILAGIAGMAVTFKFTGNMFDSFFASVEGVHFGMHINVACIIVAIIAGIITVLISAYIPSKRASRQSPIDAIHQSTDIIIKARSVKTSKLTYKLFGFEGMLASKNFKRSRKKYRATVLSLFMSVVLFITATSFCSYLQSSIGSLDNTPDCQIGLMLDEGAYEPKENSALLGQIKSIDGVESVCMYLLEHADIFCKTDVLSAHGLERYSEKYGMSTCLFFIDNESYIALLEKDGIAVDSHMDAENPVGVLFDYANEYSKKTATDERAYNFKAESGTLTSSITCYYYDGYYVHAQTEYNEETGYDEDTGKFVYTDSDGVEHFVTKDEITSVKELTYDGVIKSLPAGIRKNQLSDVPCIVYPFNAVPVLLSESVITGIYVNYSVFTDSASKVYNEMTTILKSNSIDYLNFINYNESAVANKAMSTVVEVFSYGFIALISLIAAANVFNTISTNIMLRRREFAMLKSVGMTQKSFRKMMNLECILYGVKGLVAGIPVSVGLTYLIYLAVRQEFDEIGFYIPWSSFVIAIGSVFLVVFATMLYSMQKIKKDNPVETLKNENL